MASNWTGTTDIDSYLGKDQYILGYAGGGGTLRNADGQSELWGNIGADITLGTVYPEQNELLQKVDALFRQIKIVSEIKWFIILNRFIKPEPNQEFQCPI